MGADADLARRREDGGLVLREIAQTPDDDVDAFQDVERHLTLVCERGGMPAHVAQGLALLVEGARVESAVQRSSQPARAARLTAAMLMSVYEARPAF